MTVTLRRRTFLSGFFALLLAAQAPDSCGPRCPPEPAGAIITVDRIEGDIAVVEAGSGELNVPIECLPAGAVEGDLLSEGRIDSEATTERRQAVLELQRRLLDRSRKLP